MLHLDVWLTWPHGTQIRAAEMVVADPDVRHGGALRGEFRYTPAFLAHGDAFALDPAHLPLRVDPHVVDRPHAGVPAAIEDALPDDWGRQLLIRGHRLPRKQQRVPELLLAMGAGGMGALTFSLKGEPSPNESGASIADLDTLVKAAEALERGEALADEAMALLLRAGSSPGGARPKVLISDAGEGWIAKFPSIKDKHDIVCLEAAALTLASQIGLDIPEHRLTLCGERCVLLVRRFDVNAVGRYQRISLQTLLGAEGYYDAGYGDVADAIRLHSAQPHIDLPLLYRVMVFNAVIGNTDDHLKNLSLLHDEAGWRLAPAYDLLPNVNHNTEHVLRFATNYHAPSADELLRLAPAFGFSRRKCQRLIDEVREGVKDWVGVCEHVGVSGDETRFFWADIERRVQCLS